MVGAAGGWVMGGGHAYFSLHSALVRYYHSRLSLLYLRNIGVDNFLQFTVVRSHATTSSNQWPYIF
jgi:hypothetical protein